MNYSDLLVVETREGTEARLRAAAKAFGASPDTWKDRSMPAVVVYALSVMLVLIYDLIRYFAGGAAFTSSSDSSLAEQYAYSQFGLLRRSAASAVFQVTVICEEGQGPYDLTTEFVLSTSWGQTYFLQTPVTLESGSSVSLLFQASVAGTAGNVAPEALSVLTTPLAGVTTSPEELYESGLDKETIPALYARCQLMWGGIGAGSQEFVQNQAINLDPLLTKVRSRVDSTSAGQMIIYAGQTAAPANDDQVAALAAQITALEVFQAVTVTVLPASPEELSISGIVTTLPGRLTEAQEAVSVAIALWQEMLGYGDMVRPSDIWRKSLGVDASGVAVVGLFSSPAIDYVVDLVPDIVYNGPQWGLTILVNDLTFVDPAE